MKNWKKIKKRQKKILVKHHCQVASLGGKLFKIYQNILILITKYNHFTLSDFEENRDMRGKSEVPQFGQNFHISKERPRGIQIGLIWTSNGRFLVWTCLLKVVVTDFPKNGHFFHLSFFLKIWYQILFFSWITTNYVKNTWKNSRNGKILHFRSALQWM